MSFISDLPLKLACPKCGHEMEKTFGWLAANKESNCICGATMVVKADEAPGINIGTNPFDRH